jgi:hypothetical protein
MFRLKLGLILLKIGAFVAVGGPLAAFTGSFSGHEEVNPLCGRRCCGRNTERGLAARARTQ